MTPAQSKLLNALILLASGALITALAGWVALAGFVLGVIAAIGAALMVST